MQLRGRKILSPPFAREGLYGKKVQLSIRSPLAPLNKGGKDACKPPFLRGVGGISKGIAALTATVLGYTVIEKT